MASRLLQLRFDEMQAMPCTMDGDETVHVMDAITVRAELDALNRLRSRCDDAYDAILQDENAGPMAHDQAVRLNRQMVVVYRRGDAALRRRLEGLAAEIAPERGHADSTAQMLQILRKREPKIGKFHGEPHLWPAFRDLFMSEVHNREDLEPVAKLTFLKAACVGKAYTALGLWSHTNESYDGAWALMQKRYDDSYKITQGLVNMLFALPVAQAETHDGLSHLVDTLQSVLRQLASAQVEVTNWDVWLIALIINRLPIATVDAWEQHRGTDSNPTLASMLEFISTRARGRLYHEQSVSKPGPSAAVPPRRENEAQGDVVEKATSHPSKRSRNDHADQPRNKRFKQEPPVSRPFRANNNNNPFRGNDAARRSNRDNKPQRSQPACLLCKQDHWIAKCPKFLEVPVRRRNELMDQWGHCRVCFRQHAAGECKWTGCNRCTGNHHLINCPVTDKKINALLAAHRNNEETVQTKSPA